jgi:hypothetical protein
VLEAFGLSWLAGIIGAVLTDSLKERLKPARSDEKARDRGFALFERLQEIKSATDSFVAALAGYAALVELGVSDAVRQLGSMLGPEEGSNWQRSQLTMEEAAAERVEMLRRMVTAPDGPTAADIAVVRSQATLWKTASDLRGALEALEPALRVIDPQLAIHQPDVSAAINLYVQSRGYVLAQLEDLAWHASAESSGELRKIVVQAQENQQVIDGAIREFRAFLAGEFSFKESF